MARTPTRRASVGRSAVVCRRCCCMGHMIFMVVLAVTNLVWLVPILARLQFAASDWQTTDGDDGAVPAFSCWRRSSGTACCSVGHCGVTCCFSGCSGGLFRWAASGWRRTTGRCSSCHVISPRAGMAGWAPANGALLKRFYPDAYPRAGVRHPVDDAVGRRDGGGVRSPACGWITGIAARFASSFQRRRS